MLRMPNPSATTRLSGAGPNAVISTSVPWAVAAINPSARSSRNAVKIDRPAPGDGAACRARVSSTVSPGNTRYANPHPHEVGEQSVGGDRDLMPGLLQPLTQARERRDIAARPGRHDEH